jgi:hypothetical protein
MRLEGSRPRPAAAGLSAGPRAFVGFKVTGTLGLTTSATDREAAIPPGLPYFGQHRTVPYCRIHSGKYFELTPNNS